MTPADPMSEGLRSLRTPEQQLEGLARLVRGYTEVTRSHNGRGRPPTYAARVDAIAGASRQLAEAVLAYLEGNLPPLEVDDDLPF